MSSAKRKPIIFKSRARAMFSEMDPYGHMNTQFYISHFLEHRMHCMRTDLNWNLEYLMQLPIAFYVQEIQVQYLRSVVGDNEFEITSHIEDFQERTCEVQMTMTDVKSQKVLSRCKMILACFVKSAGKAGPWPTHIIDTFMPIAQS